MDLLFSRYASPMDFIKLYINQGRFGEFVENILGMEYKRKKQELEKEDNWKLWTMYVHSMSDLSFIDWKAQVLKPNRKAKKGKDEEMTEEDITSILNKTFSK